MIAVFLEQLQLVSKAIWVCHHSYRKARIGSTWLGRLAGIKPGVADLLRRAQMVTRGAKLFEHPIGGARVVSLHGAADNAYAAGLQVTQFEIVDPSRGVPLSRTLKRSAAGINGAAVGIGCRRVKAQYSSYGIMSSVT